MCLCMVACFMPTMAFAEGAEIAVNTDAPAGAGAQQNGNGAPLDVENDGQPVNVSETENPNGGAQNPAQGNGNEEGTPANIAKVIKADASSEQEYPTLAEAVAAAKATDTIEILKDFELTEGISIDETVTVNLANKTVTVAIPTADATQSAFSVSANSSLTMQNGTILGTEDFDNRAIESQGGAVVLDAVKIGDFNAASGNGGAVYVDGGAITTRNRTELGFYDYTEQLYHGNSAMNGGALYVKDAQVTLENSRFLGNQSSDNTGSSEQYWFGGGAIFLNGAETSAVITGCYFFSNETDDFGGAIHLDTVGYAMLEGNTMKYSSAYNHRLAEGGSRGGDGGGVYVRICKEIILSNNTIQDSFCMSDGGGLDVLGTDTQITLEKNIIKGNYAGNRGGGIRFKLSEASNLELKSGEISDNSANWGAGIDYTGHEMIPLKLQNVLITGNQAVRGAGIWACPTSETVSHSTLGGAIYGNTATGKCSQGIGKPELDASGSEVRYEGVDTPDKFTLQSNPPSETTTMTVMKRALGGGLMKWYQDEADNRYKAGDKEALPAVYTKTNNSFGLHGELSETYQKLAADEALLVIKDNVASARGGAIATNSPVEIGLKDADVSVHVEKTWEAKEHPGQVKVDLYRINADGTEIKLDSDVELNAGNNWSASFSDLPSKYVDENGDVQKCQYTVREQQTEGWACRTKQSYDKEKRIYTITLTNVSAGNLTVSKAVTGSGDQNKAFTFTVTLDDETISGTYGDMIFTGGVASFTLKHGESRTASNLPAGIGYTVTESDNSGYTVTKKGDTGTIAAGETAAAEFTNYMGGGYIPTPTPDTKYPLTISKLVAGLDSIPSDYAVTVTVTSKTGAAQTLTLKAGEQKTIELPYGEYTISETAPSVEGYTLTGQTISEKNFVLSAGGKSVVITNTYTKEAEEEPGDDPTPDKPAKPADRDTDTDTAVPKTGDTSPLAGSALLLMLSACGIAAALRRKEE